MTDDNLDDTQPKKTVVQKMNEIEHNKIWNAAIEAAAKCVDKDTRYDQAGYQFGPATEIRKLKKVSVGI
jgi:hypothetical protein